MPRRDAERWCLAWVVLEPAFERPFGRIQALARGYYRVHSGKEKSRRFLSAEVSKTSVLANASYAATGTAEPIARPDLSIQACARGEWGAWRQFHREYANTVAAFLRRLGVEASEIDDVSQEVFLQLFRSLSQFRGQAELKTWLYRICATHAFRLRRKKRLIARLTELFTSAHSVPDGSASTEDAYVARTLLDRAMTVLSDRERLVFVLFELEGLSGAEIARIADCPINTVWRRLFDARSRLKSALAKAAE